MKKYVFFLLVIILTYLNCYVEGDPRPEIEKTVWSETPLALSYVESNENQVSIRWHNATNMDYLKIFRCIQTSENYCYDDALKTYTYKNYKSISRMKKGDTSYIDEPGLPEKGLTVYYYLKSYNEKGSDKTKPLSIFMGFTKIDANALMNANTEYIDFLNGSQGTMFQLDLSNFANNDTIYFFANGGASDADISIYTNLSDAQNDNTTANQFTCSPTYYLNGSCWGNGSSEHIEQLAFTITDNSKTFYFRIWNYSPEPSILRFGVSTSSYEKSLCSTTAKQDTQGIGDTNSCTELSSL